MSIQLKPTWKDARVAWCDSIIHLSVRGQASPTFAEVDYSIGEPSQTMLLINSLQAFSFAALFSVLVNSLALALHVVCDPWLLTTRSLCKWLKLHNFFHYSQSKSRIKYSMHVKLELWNVILCKIIWRMICHLETTLKWACQLSFL